MKPDPSTICFGMNTELDQSSCATYLKLLGRDEFAKTFAERLSSEEIEILVDMVTSLMQKHLSKQEYHKLFLLDEHHHD